MLFRKTSRKNRRNVNPRLTGLESLEGRKLMAGDLVQGLALDVNVPGIELKPIPGGLPELPGFPQQDPLVGKWTAPGNGGITEIEITKSSGEYDISAKGDCTPTDCDWGSTDLHALGTSVSDDTPDYAFGNWDHGFKDTSITVEIRDNGLFVQVFNAFKDGSNRENYHDEYFLTKAGNINDVLYIHGHEDVGDVLLGGWVNEDVDTRSLTKLRFSEEAGNVDAEAWASCSPTDCHWGTADTSLYGTSISDDTYSFATSYFDHGFAERFVTSHVVGGELKVETYTVFNDGSSRSNYHSEHTMWKVGDSNRDGRFDSGDFVAAFAAGEYEDGIDGNSTWEEGDWNRDGDFDSADFVEAFKCGGYEAPSLSNGYLHDAAIDDVVRTLAGFLESNQDDDEHDFDITELTRRDA